jgi:hypothetical protein
MELYQLPDWKQLQVLSVSRDKVSALTFNAGGDWLALGCAALGQLLVWEWRSEAYVLKQQVGHCHRGCGQQLGWGGDCRMADVHSRHRQVSRP